MKPEEILDRLNQLTPFSAAKTSALFDVASDLRQVVHRDCADSAGRLRKVRARCGLRDRIVFSTRLGSRVVHHVCEDCGVEVGFVCLLPAVDIP